LLYALTGHSLEALFTLLLHTGLRIGEALALTWRDVDFSANAVSVNATLTDDGKRADPKSLKGFRTIDGLPDDVMRMLATLRGSKKVVTLNDGFVFHTASGLPYNAHNVRNAFKVVLRKAGLEHSIRVHDLRGTALSHMAMAGVPINVAQELAGHSDPRITSKYYITVLGDAKSKAVSSWGERIAAMR
jgi:integrase